MVAFLKNFILTSGSWLLIVNSFFVHASSPEERIGVINTGGSDSSCEENTIIDPLLTFYLPNGCSNLPFSVPVESNETITSVLFDCDREDMTITTYSEPDCETGSVVHNVSSIGETPVLCFGSLINLIHLSCGEQPENATSAPSAGGSQGPTIIEPNGTEYEYESKSPSISPSTVPSFSPSIAPSFSPSYVPSMAPSGTPSTVPPISDQPTLAPGIVVDPTAQPTSEGSLQASLNRVLAAAVSILVVCLL